MQVATNVKTAYFQSASAANTALTVSLGAGAAGPSQFGEGLTAVREILVAYSAAPTHSGATVTRTLAGGTGDTVIASGAANARYTYFRWETPLKLNDRIGISVTAPAGGAGITSVITIIYEQAA